MFPMVPYLGGQRGFVGGVGPPAISRTDGRRETGEAAFESTLRDAFKPTSKLNI